LDNKVLLAAFAHPDDESFGPGGTLALYAQQGVQVHLVCATRGEVGVIPPDMLDKYSTVAELREAELHCAAENLGLASVHYLDYRDSGMLGTEDNDHPQALTSAPQEQVTGRISDLIQEIGPQVVITFDPFGGYGHPDHIVMSRATEEAFFSVRARNQVPRKLYYSTYARKMLKLITRLMPLAGRDPRKWGKNQDIDLLSMAQHEFPLHAYIDVRSVAEIRNAAVACHASQLDPGPRRGLFIRLMFKLAWSRTRDTFTRVHPPVNGRLKERDLFEGI
jgi:LmbE family N-acetylglucosaminyl deacetylase